MVQPRHLPHLPGFGVAYGELGFRDGITIKRPIKEGKKQSRCLFLDKYAKKVLKIDKTGEKTEETELTELTELSGGGTAQEDTQNAPQITLNGLQEGGRKTGQTSHTPPQSLESLESLVCLVVPTCSTNGGFIHQNSHLFSSFCRFSPIFFLLYSRVGISGGLGGLLGLLPVKNPGNQDDHYEDVEEAKE
jgi:hypothetical protein